MVSEALNVITQTANSCVLQPAVAVLCGDVNLSLDHADACCQPQSGNPDVRTCWHTETSLECRPGDVLFVRGCHSEAFDIAIGASYEDRGIRNDCHDCFGVALTLPLLAVEKSLVQKRARSHEPVGPQVVNTVQCTDENVDWGEDVDDSDASTDGADAVLRDMRMWYAQRIDDESVAATWKHLHRVLFKKVRHPCVGDMWQGRVHGQSTCGSDGDNSISGSRYSRQRQ